MLYFKKHISKTKTKFSFCLDLIGLVGCVEEILPIISNLPTTFAAWKTFVFCYYDILMTFQSLPYGATRAFFR